ncbi:MAG: aconitate hydratase AcnA [Anaerolineales bacterium]|nr:aconitate hydratase AcnA [Anaerolineales bacterium]
MVNRSKVDPFNVRDVIETQDGPLTIYRLARLEQQGYGNISRLPFSIKVILEAVLRSVDGLVIKAQDVEGLASWDASNIERRELPFKPARVIMQDFTGVPAIVDLAAMRSAFKRLGGDPIEINPVIPVDLVIDHSVQIDQFGSPFAMSFNAEREFDRNRERYEFLKWGASAFENFRVVPPATGIVHQVNLEYLGRVITVGNNKGNQVAYPDSLVGTDSHTTMINALGVVGWGVGGIEAEAVVLGQPIYMLTPEVVGFKLTGELPDGATATDLVLTVTQMLRKYGVVGKFVEYFGPGIDQLSLPDRATIANMAPEYGATMGFFPVDQETLRYLENTGRSPSHVSLVKRYCQEQGLFRSAETIDPMYSNHIELDMGTVESSIAGPKRPQDKILLRDSKDAFAIALKTNYGVTKSSDIQGLNHGAVVIASITSCTNTSNPSVMIGAGLLAKKAVERGIDIKPWVKTSLAPGSRVVRNYLEAAGLISYLEALRFHIVGYGCTTCIGNSGPLPDDVAREVAEKDLVVAAVLSGNRNFEGRINPLVKANYLASPPLVVAYALAGTMEINFETDPLGKDPDGLPVYLRDIWPTQADIADCVSNALDPDMFLKEYGNVFDGNETWNQIAVGEGDIYAWDPDSTYIKEPPFFAGLTTEEPDIQPIKKAHVLAYLGDSVTTDHISPAGAIPADSAAGQYLIGNEVKVSEFNSFGSRRGNHEVMMRGTFGNIRIRNKVIPGVEGSFTLHFPTETQMSIYDAAMRYKKDGTPLVVIAGKEYGTGSSRDWAAKGTILLGVKAVLAESYERIHRSNLVGMGVLPLQFKQGENAEVLGLTGTEQISIDGLDNNLKPLQEVLVRAVKHDKTETQFTMKVRVDTPVEVKYYRNGGILHAVLRDMAAEVAL